METVELENEELAMEIQSVKAENNELAMEVKSFKAENDELAIVVDSVKAENSSLKEMIAQQNVKMQAQNERLEKLERIALATTPTPTTASVENKKTSVFNLSNLFSSLKGFWVSSN